MTNRSMSTLVMVAMGVVCLGSWGCGSTRDGSTDSAIDSGSDVAMLDAPSGENPGDPGLVAGDAHIEMPPFDAGEDVFDPAAGDPEFSPWLVRRSSAIDGVRGWVVRQGHLHAHSVFSHDACDNMPRIGGETGARNEDCFQDLRRGICEAGLDFLFLTDHLAMFPEYEFPEVLLHEPDAGDLLVMRDGLPVANRIPCPDGTFPLVAAGLDRHWLAVGLERHVGDTVDERRENYRNASPETFARLRQQGALITTAYSSEWEEEEILAHAWDGYEIYNPATNMRERLMEIATALGMMAEDPSSVPVPELAILAAFEEGAINLRYWSLIAQSRPVFSFIGPNAHRNTFAMELDDGERLDSYRRIFRWYGNFLLIPAEQAGDADDRTYVATMRAGRMYSAFLFFGYPVGFDFVARVGEELHEMGAQLADTEGVTFSVRVPRVYGRLAPGIDAPEITAHLLRATVEGGWESVASGSEDFDFSPAVPGVYRVDVRIVPHHLLPWLGRTPQAYLTERSWVVSNPIYVGLADSPTDPYTFQAMVPTEPAPDPSARICVEAADPVGASEKVFIDCPVEGGRFAPTAQADVGPLRVMAYNLERGTRLDGQIAAIRAMDPRPDVILASELDRGCDRTGGRHIARDLAEALEMDWVFAVEFVELRTVQGDPPGYRAHCEHGNAILSRFPLGNVRALRHATNDSWYFDPGTSGDQPRLGGRVAVLADIDLGGRFLHLASLHLESAISDTARTAQAAEVARVTADFPYPVIVGGDLNAGLYFLDVQTGETLDPTVAALTAAGFADAHSVLEPESRVTAPEYGFVLDLILGRDVAFTAPAVGDAVTWDPLSDHRPVWATVTLGP